MPLDGAFINCLKTELLSAVNCYIDKIHLPNKNEFVFGIRGFKTNKKIYISLNPECPRISFTNLNFENPPSPPMLCMLLRKHLSGGKIVAVENVGAERLIIFKILATNEMGDKVLYSLITELTGHKTNLILTDENGKILDAARRSDIETSTRLILPGAIYTLPETDERCDFVSGDLEKAAEATVGTDIPLANSLIKNIAGISPLICREIAYLLSGDVDISAKNTDKNKLASTLKNIKNAVAGGGTPYILSDKNGTPKDYSFIPITQYENLYNINTAESFSSLLETFYFEREQKRRIEHLKSDILKLTKNLIARNLKKLNLRKAELKKSENKEQLRIFGELLKANLYRIKKGAESVTVENYYTEESKPVTIKLDSALSPQNNAAKYFKEYKKACVASQTLVGLIKECEEEAKYLDSVLFEIESANTSAELGEIRTELKENGYIKLKKSENKKQIKSGAKPLIFSKDGFKIAVGRNNIQNDILTLKTAEKSDIWFHTKNIHGSHVILFTNGKTPGEEVILYAANLAAKYSKASFSNRVPVDFAPVKYVKKPGGAKPGMVIYKNNRTIFANPDALEEN